MDKNVYTVVVVLAALVSLFIGWAVGGRAMEERPKSQAQRVSETSFILGEAKAPELRTILDPRFGTVCYLHSGSLNESLSCVAIDLQGMSEQPRGDL